MKKGITFLLIAFMVCILGACQADPGQYAANYDAATMTQYAMSMMQSLPLVDDATLDMVLSARNAELAEDNETALEIKASYKSWKDAKDDLGAYTPGPDDACMYTFGKDEATVTLRATFEKRPADVVFYYDYNGVMTGFRVNPVYTTGEKLAKAGRNTLLGMGTVFVVLILIALIISLFRYINRAENYFARRKKLTTEAPFEHVDPSGAPRLYDPETLPQPEPVDDQELVAVITAALAASMNTSVDNLVVRSIRRKQTNRW